MPHYQEQTRLPYSPEQMYALVADVASYPQFLPWCVGATILEQSSEHIEAELIVGNGLLREAFTSHVTLAPHHTIEARYTEGPFRYLHNQWKFSPEPESQGCVVDFEVDFELKSSLLQQVMNSLFTHAVHKMVHAFEMRAKVLYGRS
jgi:coenzyme Q-binding protein COQ10